MTLTRRDLIASAGSAIPLALLPRAANAQAGPALTDAIAESYFAISPESATSLGIDTGARAALRGQSSDRSPAGQARQAAWLDATLARIDAADTPALDAETRRHLDIARTAYRTARAGFAFGYGAVSIGGWRNGPYVVAQNMGAFLDTPRYLDASHKVENAADAEAYLARLQAYARNIDGETERLKQARGQQVVAPDFILAKTLSALRMTRDEAPDQTLVVTSLARRTENIPGDWRARAERIAREAIQPALARQVAELEAHAAIANPNAGAWDLPQGGDYYAWALGAATTTRMTPDEVHAAGLAQLAELTAEMDRLLKAEGLSQGSVGARLVALAKDPRYAFPTGDEGRAEILKFIQGRIDDIRPRLPRAFGTLVRGNVEVRRIPPAEELGAPGAYGGAGSIDGSVPGRFWINLRTTQAHNRFNLPTLTYHEAIPGHVWQGEYVHKLPLLRTLMGFSAFSEGWGLYAEQIAGEIGVYDALPVGRIGYLQSMAFRAARMVVDTGIHVKRWDRMRARAWFADAIGETQESVANEIDRYCVWPGQACGYKIGHTEINRQRDRARAALGSRFDVRAFNDMVVGGGGRPLVVLERDVDAFVAVRRG